MAHTASNTRQQQPQSDKFTTRTSFRIGNGYTNRAADRRESVARKQARRAKFAVMQGAGY